MQNWNIFLKLWIQEQPNNQTQKKRLKELDFFPKKSELRKSGPLGPLIVEYTVKMLLLHIKLLCLPYYLSNVKILLFLTDNNVGCHGASRRCLTCEMWRPKDLCTLQHSSHIRTPLLIDTHSGPKSVKKTNFFIHISQPFKKKENSINFNALVEDYVHYISTIFHYVIAGPNTDRFWQREALLGAWKLAPKFLKIHFLFCMKLNPKNFSMFCLLNLNS